MKAKRALAFFLSVLLCFSLLPTALADDVDTQQEPDAQNLVVTSAATEETGGEAGSDAETLATILYTNDVHTYINKDITYSDVAAYRDTLENVLLVDAGDHIQGTAYGGMDNGETILKLMNAAGYDLATLGNHEFDYGMEGALNAIAWAEFPYVSCNFYHESNGVAGELVLDAYKVFEVNGIRIALIGITTPESFTKSTPKYFQDDDGNYIYGIAGGADGTALYEYVQTAIDAAAQEADYVIALGHLGIDPSSVPWTSEEVIANTTGLDAFIDGHSHSTVAMETVADKDGNEVVLTQTGSYFAALGQMEILSDGTITSELLDADDLADIEPDSTVAAIENAWIDAVDAQLGEKIADSEINFTIYDADGNRAIRKMETNLGDFNADAYYWYINEKEGLDCDLAIMNGGGIRASVDAGDWTYLTCKTVNTFGNVLCLVEVSGQDILDALEFGVRYITVGESGGFLHVAGLRYEIDTSVESTVQEDELGVWVGGPTGEYRVKNVQVYNRETGAYEALDTGKTYSVAGTNYTLRNCGDGFDMFGDTVLVKDYISEDYLALADYAMAFADTDGDGYAEISTENCPLAAYEGYLLDYETSTGAGRITVIAGEAAWEPTDLVVNIGGTEDSISVVWYDTSENAGTLTFGGVEYPAAVSAAQRDGYYVNRATVTGLTASTDYTYTITSGDGEVSRSYSYSTAAFGTGETFSFAVVGDPQIGASGNADSDTEGWNTAVEAILSNGTAYSFLFSMGDQVNAYYGESQEYAGYSSALTAAIEAYDADTDGDYIAYLVSALGMTGSGYESYITSMLQNVTLSGDVSDVELILKTMGVSGNNTDEVEAEYDGYLSPTGLSGIAMATIVGNHDAGNDNSTLYTNHFAMPNVTAYGENQDGDGDYSFTYNGVLFMVLNSSNLSIAEHKQFMEETLAANPDATWNVVAFHKSIYSVASHVTESDIETLRNGLSPIFAELGIDLVLQGHDHVYARSYVMGGATGMEAQDTESGAQTDIYNADGVVYVTFNSASGSKFYNITQEAFTYTAVQNQEKVANYSTATVTADSFTVTTCRVTDGSVVDTFTLHKDTPELTVSASASSKKITVSFASEDTDITGYVITLLDASGNELETQTATAAGSVTFSGLTNGTTYTITVCATNAAGQTATETVTAKPKTSSSGGASSGGNSASTSSSSTTTAETTTTEGTDTADDAPFTDVDAADYYYDALTWALEQEITTGTSDSTFSPDVGCTRAQIVTFLYRYAGSPAVTGDAADFADVGAGAYYCDAVTWAVQNGITDGVGGGLFDPDAICTRAQIVTFLHRFAAQPESAADNGFADVSASAYYAAAVAWAVEADITNGIGENAFAPDAACTRAQAVTFLYRYSGTV